MKDVINSINRIANEWDHFKKNYKNQKDKLCSLETKLNKLDSKNFNNENKEDNMDDINLLLNKSQENNLEFKHFSTDVEDRGEHTVSANRYEKIIRELKNSSPIRKLASTINISSNALDMLIQNGNFDSGWVTERQARAESETPRLTRKRILVHELYSQPKATQKLLDDNSVDFDSWLTEQLIESFSRAEHAAFINGDGNNKPTGILSYNDEIEQVDVSSQQRVSAEDLINLINSLDDRYHKNAAFLMNRRTLGEIQSLRDGEGRFIWQSSLSEKMADTIFGIPVYCTSDMPTIGENSKFIALADFKSCYQIVDRTGISLMKDPYTEKPFVKFYATKRVGGDVVDFNAIKLLKA